MTRKALQRHPTLAMASSTAETDAFSPMLLCDDRDLSVRKISLDELRVDCREKGSMCGCRFLDVHCDAERERHVDFVSHKPWWRALVQRLEERSQEKKWPSALFVRLLRMRQFAADWNETLDRPIAATLARLAIAHKARLPCELVVMWLNTRSAAFEDSVAFRQLSDIPILPSDRSMADRMSICLRSSERPLHVYAADIMTHVYVDGSIAKLQQQGREARERKWLPLLLDIHALWRWPEALCELVVTYLEALCLPDGFKNSIDYEVRIMCEGSPRIRAREERAGVVETHYNGVLSTCHRMILRTPSEQVAEVRIRDDSGELRNGTFHRRCLHDILLFTARVGPGWVRIHQNVEAKNETSSPDVPVWISSFWNRQPLLVRRFEPGTSAPFETPFCLTDIRSSLLYGSDPQRSTSSFRRREDSYSAFQLYLHQLGDRLIRATDLPAVVNVEPFGKTTLADFEALISEDAK